MSLILDALRRADAERQAGQVPGLHAQPLPAPAHEPPTRAHAGPWRWAILGTIVGLALPTVWYLVLRDTPRAMDQPATLAPPAALAPAATPAATPAAAPATAPARVAPTTPAQQTEAPASNVAAASPGHSTGSAQIAEPAPWPEREIRKAPTRAPAAPAAGTGAQADATRQADPARNAAPASPAPPIYDREQLPQEIRAALPALAIGGSIFSPNARERTLIVNGRLYRENDVLAPDLALEQIQQRSAVFRYRGYRFLMLF